MRSRPLSDSAPERRKVPGSFLTAAGLQVVQQMQLYGALQRGFPLTLGPHMREHHLLHFLT